MKNKFVCVHGHFYQPPRENPWLEEVELQDSARPHHDWNEKITAECYAPNTASRLLDKEGRIVDIVNNYSSMSFNFGPTLLSWLERKHPGTYGAILEADAESREMFSGHGSAMAQCYNHMIMPLANSRDKDTQIAWGLKDFEKRFGRKAEGMWLPETAVDMETLETLARHSVKFTILAPNQAKGVRKLGKESWDDVSGGRVDPRRPYICRLSGGKSISLFFYDGHLSHEIAFNGMLNDGKVFKDRLLAALEADSAEPQISHAATDGETYGHHHRYGDMALAYCLSDIKDDAGAELTVYGEFLKKNPPQWEARIWENSSWSCAHGVERWRGDCGCNSGGKPGWRQKWRAPLREALDWLRDNLAEVYEKYAGEILREPWKARNDYINVILDRSEASRKAFFAKHAAGGDLPREKEVKAMRLLEMQRSAMLMYTSCGWFFDDISGIETVQILSYAARAVQLARQAADIDLEKVFLDLLERAPGNIPEYGDGRKTYEKLVKPEVLDLLRVGVHYGASSIFKRSEEQASIYCYDVKGRELKTMESGPQKLAVGTVDITSRVTTETDSVSFVMLYLGGYNLLGAAREFMGKDAFAAMKKEAAQSFAAGNLAEMTKLISANFPQGSYSLWYLFRDEQRKAVNQIFSAAREEMINSFRQIYNHHSSILDISSRLNIPLPSAFMAVGQTVLSEDISDALRAVPVDSHSLGKAAKTVKKFSFSVDKPYLNLAVTEALDSMTGEFAAEPGNPERLERVVALLEAVEPLGLDMNLWRVQNIFFKTGRPVAEKKAAEAAWGNMEGRRWLDLFDKASSFLGVKFGYASAEKAPSGELA